MASINTQSNIVPSDDSKNSMTISSNYGYGNITPPVPNTSITPVTPAQKALQTSTQPSTNTSFYGSKPAYSPMYTQTTTNTLVPKPGDPQYYANQIQQLQGQALTLSNQYSPLIAAPFAQPGIGSAPQSVSDYDLARYKVKQSGIDQALEAAKVNLAASLPQQQGTSSTLYNPLLGAGAGGSIISGANRQSVYDLTQQKNQLQSQFNGADANFQLLVNTAKQGGVNDTSIPALNQLQQNVARGLTSSEAVTNFQSTLATTRAQYAAILGGGTATVDSQNRAAQAIPDDISIDALESLQQQMAAEAQNRINGIDQTIQSLGASSYIAPTGSTGGWMFGSFF